MKTKNKPSAAPKPKFVEDHIREIRKQAFLDSAPACVEVNGPRALIQCTGEGQLAGIGWVLRQPLYAASPDLLKTALALVAILDTAAQHRGHGGDDAEDLATSAEADALRAAIVAAEAKR